MASRPRDYVRVAGPDAEDFLQRMVSNDVTEAPCQALLLTPKARVIAPLTIVRRDPEDFLLLTEPGLGETVRSNLLRARFAAKVEIEPEEHTSVVVFGEDDGIPAPSSASRAPSCSTPISSRHSPGRRSSGCAIEAKVPAWGKEVDDSILPAEAGLDETHISFTKGCYPGQEPIARLRHRGKVNRSLRVLEVESAEPGDEIRQGDKVVGRVTSAVSGKALGYVRVEVSAGAELESERLGKPRGCSARRSTRYTREVPMKILRGALASTAALVSSSPSQPVAATAAATTATKAKAAARRSAGMTAELHGTKDVSGETGKVEIEMYDDYFEPTILKGDARPDGHARAEERGREPAHADDLRPGRSTRKSSPETRPRRTSRSRRRAS